MRRDFRGQPGDGSDGSPPSEAWLFAQAILGNPVPTVVSPHARAKSRREELQRLAAFSPKHAEELRRLQAAENEARRQHALLQWAAQISTRAEEKLRGMQREQSEECEGWRAPSSSSSRCWKAPGIRASTHDLADRRTPDGGPRQEQAGRGRAIAQPPVHNECPFHRGVRMRHVLRRMVRRLSADLPLPEQSRQAVLQNRTTAAPGRPRRRPRHTPPQKTFQYTWRQRRSRLVITGSHGRCSMSLVQEWNETRSACSTSEPNRLDSMITHLTPGTV